MPPNDSINYIILISIRGKIITYKKKKSGRLLFKLVPKDIAVLIVPKVYTQLRITMKKSILKKEKTLLKLFCNMQYLNE